MVEKCTVVNCDREAARGRKGYCLAHYKRWHRYGDPLQGTAMTGQPMQWILDHTSFTGDDCLLWPYARGSNGRGGLFYKGKISKPANVMCELVNGPRPSANHQGAHSCGNGNNGCCNPNHLSWKTQSGNEADKLRHGTSNRGDRNGQSKLTKDQVIEIRRLKGKVRQEAVARQFGVSQSAVSAIQLGKAWSWLR